ncbi:Phosphonoacetaldehyde hydrolase [Fundidesulfovibrio magnetotacticus]|uniref:phosphonoacetaldehyde hydrolase n=1 Tax=Fundidesulfovibrio magnetotacticus TaxID=2730080 RepID=A0A6V8LJV2_9BACT|nr:phosphonoacetaldehyde hydrolase [Fundidesulfovibrio magnetotacticus]GFK92993.1 Phosphonoacetaldehyde hydrolase [Fundidesulfovibrio magnetotacticus]
MAINPLKYVKAVVLDWAGTVVDHGCIGPVAVFVEVFKRHGVDVTVAHARKPMGLMKKDHVRSMTRDPEVAALWRAAHGRDPDEADVDAMYLLTEPLMVECIARHADIIPGALDAVAAFRAMGLKVGSTTGYTRPMMDVMTVEAAKKGYVPDTMVCSSDTPAGRPTPFMCYQAALNLGVFPFWEMVKIGDTESDVAEGKNAGMWTIGLSTSGNEMGLTEAELAALDPAEKAARQEAVTKRLLAVGAHYVVPSLADCPPLLAEIDARLARGERPSCKA